MFKWLDKKFSNIQREEAVRFLDSLHGADIVLLNLVAAGGRCTGQLFIKS